LIRGGNIFSDYAIQRSIIDDMVNKLLSQKGKKYKDLTYRGIDLSSVDINLEKKKMKNTLTNMFLSNNPKADSESLNMFSTVLGLKKNNSQNLENNLSPTEGKVVQNFLNSEAKEAEEAGLPNEYEDYSVVYFAGNRENTFDFPTDEVDESGQQIFEEKNTADGADYAELRNGEEKADLADLEDFAEDAKDRTNTFASLRDIAGINKDKLTAYLQDIAKEKQVTNNETGDEQYKGLDSMVSEYNENAMFPDISFREVLSFLSLMGGTVGVDIDGKFDEIDKNADDNDIVQKQVDLLNKDVPELNKKFQEVLFTSLKNHLEKLVDSDNTKSLGRFGFDKINSVLAEIPNIVSTKGGN
jgi:transposase-like protein